MKSFLALILLAVPQDPSADEAATSALKKLSARFGEVRTLSAKVVQTRRTELLDQPITSSGMMYYRRDPARMVFHLSEPRRTEIHMDKSSYQVYRPDEKRLERIDFENEDIPGRILMVFEPKVEEIRKSFEVRGGASRDGRIEVRLEASDEKVRRRLRKLTLLLDIADGTLRRVSYTDAEGDDVEFALDAVALNPELPAEIFQLKIPDGTRVLRHSVKLEK
jgi:outer membrane lipoprotein-sorting protein